MALRESQIRNPDDDATRDLGFGAVVARESRKRLLNRDGSFNVMREGLSLLQSLSPYHYLLTTTWPRFLGVVVLFFLVTNAVFGLAFFACGPGQIAGSAAATLGEQVLEDFFFSVQTFATIGYGGMHPVGLAANVLVTLESLVGLLGFALATGLLFARFSKPTAKILFSRNAIIAPYRGITAFEFRIANARSNELIQVEAQVLLSRFKLDGSGNREFLPLKLERDKVTFFPLAWTIVHPINEESPLWETNEDDLADWDAEFLVLLSAIDETFSQAVHARSSYKHHEVVCGARFASLFNPPRPDGVLSIDISRLDIVEKQLPRGAGSD
ncbi:MAG TPA: ion channel [Thermoanaerobaculia bacterium]|jgi:inward rectifier potassium channel|nr:ion channel [Thermoanaerobaculia bacterium]